MWIRYIYSGGQLDAVENVQMWAARIFLGVGSRHPLVSLQFEIGNAASEMGSIEERNCV